MQSRHQIKLHYWLKFRNGLESISARGRVVWEIGTTQGVGSYSGNAILMSQSEAKVNIQKGCMIVWGFITRQEKALGHPLLSQARMLFMISHLFYHKFRTSIFGSDRL